MVAVVVVNGEVFVTAFEMIECPNVERFDVLLEEDCRVATAWATDAPGLTASPQLERPSLYCSQCLYKTQAHTVFISK